MDLDHFIPDSCHPQEIALDTLQVQHPSVYESEKFCSAEPSWDGDHSVLNSRENLGNNNSLEQLNAETKLTKKLLDQLIPYQDEDDHFFDPIFQFNPHSSSTSDSSFNRRVQIDQGVGSRNRVKQPSVTPFIDLLDWTSTLAATAPNDTAASFSSLFIDTGDNFPNNNFRSGCNRFIDSSFDSPMDNLDPMATLYAFNETSGNNNSPQPSCDPSSQSLPSCPQTQLENRPQPQNAGALTGAPSSENDNTSTLRRSSHPPSPSASRCLHGETFSGQTQQKPPQSSSAMVSQGTEIGSLEHQRTVNSNSNTGSSSSSYYHFYDHYPGNEHHHQYHPHHEHTGSYNWSLSPIGGPVPQALVETRIVNHCTNPLSPIQSSIQFPNGSMSVNLSMNMNMSFTANSSASPTPNTVSDARTISAHAPYGSALQSPQHHQQILWTASPTSGYGSEYGYPNVSSSSSFIHSPTHAYVPDFQEQPPPPNGQIYHQLSTRVIKSHNKQTDRIVLPPIEKEFANIPTFHRHSSPSSSASGTSGSNSADSPPTSTLMTTAPSNHPRPQTRYNEHFYHHAQYRHHSVNRGYQSSKRKEHCQNAGKSTSSSSFSRSSDLDDSPPDVLGNCTSASSYHLAQTEADVNLNARSCLSSAGMRTNSMAPEREVPAASLTETSHMGQVGGVAEKNETVIVGEPGGHLLQLGSRRGRIGNEFHEVDRAAGEEAERKRGQYHLGDLARTETGSPRSPLLDQNLTNSVVSLEGIGQYSGGPNLCEICGKSYARPSTLKTHLRTHSGERPYRCDMCYKSFSQAANLTAHLRTHSGEKPFTCQICERRFSQSSSVTTHMRTHSGERPYRCYMCRKAFSDSSTLTKHLRIHSGEKPYQCKLCHLKFSQSGNLNRHMRIHSSG